MVSANCYHIVSLNINYSSNTCIYGTDYIGYDSTLSLHDNCTLSRLYRIIKLKQVIPPGDLPQ